MQTTSDNPSAITSYIQKAMIRKTSKKPTRVNATRTEPSIPAEYTELASKLINSFAATNDELEPSHSKDSPAAPQEEKTSERFVVVDEECEFEGNGLQAQTTESLDEDTKELGGADVESSPELVAEHQKRREKEKLPVLNSRRAELIRSVNQITLRTINNIMATLKPPQAVVNIVIAYVTILQQVERKRHGSEPGYKLVVEPRPKTYSSCLDSLRNTVAAHQLTFEIVSFVDSARKEELVRLKKVREKYLAGWDMKPSAFSDRFYSARTILNFLLCLVAYIDTFDESGEQHPIKKAQTDSPTRRLIEHKILCVPDSDFSETAASAGVTARKPRSGASSSNSQRKSMGGRSKAAAGLQYQSVRGGEGSVKKKTDELIHSLLRSLKGDGREMVKKPPQQR